MGLSHSDVVDRFGTEAKIELPGVLGASDARTLTEDMMARHWARRDKLILRLPPRFITLVPGRQISLTGSPTHWQIQRSTIEGYVAVVELRPVWRAQAALAADPGRALAAHDVVAGELSMALVELPGMTGECTTGNALYLAASAPAAGWKPVPVEVSCGAFLASGRTANCKAVMGRTVTMIEDDRVEIELIDQEQWLTSCDEDALAAGANFALIGEELIQFADAQALGAGRFRLMRLLRGQAASEWATRSHEIGELFLLVNGQGLQPIALPASARGSRVTVSQPTLGGSATKTLRCRQRHISSGAQATVEGVGEKPIDAEARGLIAQILAVLREHGLMDC